MQTGQEPRAKKASRFTTYQAITLTEHSSHSVDAAEERVEQRSPTTVQKVG